MPPAAFRHRNLPLLLLQAREALMAQFRPLLNQHGVTEQQWRIIRALADDGPLEPRQLCERCQISSPSIAGVLARMEELGWVERERMDTDQRRLLVSLTPRSREIAQSMAPLVESRYRELEKQLGLDAMHEVYDVLDALLVKLQAQHQDEASTPPKAAVRQNRRTRSA